MEKRASGSIIFFFLISVIIHLLFFYIFKVETISDETVKITKVRYIKGAKSLITEKKIVKKEEKKKELIKGQIVDIARPEKEEKPLKNKYLAEYNTKTEKETSTRKRMDAAALANKLKMPNKNLQNQNNNTKYENEKVASLTKNKNKSKDEKSERKKIKKGSLAGFNGKNGKEIKGNLIEETGNLLAKDSENKKAIEAASGRIPSQYLPQTNGNDYIFASPSNDYIKEEESDEVAVNAKKFAYARYFNNIHDAVSHYWKPAHILYINDPFGTVYNKKDKYTKLNITLDKLGFIKDIVVVEASGVDALDREAINAFKRAAPFGDVPKILLDDNEKASFEFGFLVYGQKEESDH